MESRPGTPSAAFDGAEQFGGGNQDGPSAPTWALEAEQFPICSARCGCISCLRQHLLSNAHGVPLTRAGCRGAKVTRRWMFDCSGSIGQASAGCHFVSAPDFMPFCRHAWSYRIRTDVRWSIGYRSVSD